MAGRKFAMAVPRPPKASKPLDPSKTILAPPRVKPASTREYGKGGTPLSTSLSGVRGAGIGYGGSNYGGA